MFCPQVWYFTGTRQIAELHALDRLPGELLDAAVAYYRRWEQGFKYYNMPMGGDGKGGFVSIDDREGTEMSLGGNGYKPLFTSAMWSEANAIAEVAKSLGRNELAAEFAPASSPVVNGLYEAAVILFGLPLVVSFGAFVVALALAFAVMWLYDTPVRAWLKHKL